MSKTVFACTCGNDSCKVRALRNLAPFCQMPHSTPTVEPGYPTYQAAVDAARAAGLTGAVRIRLFSGGLHSGKPRRFGW